MRNLFAVPDAEHASISEVLATARAFTRAELTAIFSRSALDHAVNSGVAVRVLPGIYAGANHATSFDVRAQASLLWGGDEAVIGGRSALFAWGLIDEPPRHLDLVLPHSRRLKPPSWLRVRRCSTPVACTNRGNLRLATPAFAIVHGYGELPPGDRAGVVYRAVQRRLVGVGQLRAAMDATPRVVARRSLQRRIEMAEAGVESFLEERGLADVFNTKEFTRFVRQHEVVHEGRPYRLDMFDPATRTAVELDGEPHRSDPAQRRRDIERDAVLATVGILTLRFSYYDIVQRPDWCRWVVRQVLEARAR